MMYSRPIPPGAGEPERLSDIELDILALQREREAVGARKSRGARARRDDAEWDRLNAEIEELEKL